MSSVVAIGDARRLGGYALAGVRVRHVSTADEARAAWSDVAGEATLLVLTPEALEALAPILGEREDVVWAVVPS